MNKIRIVNNEIIPFDSSNDLKIYNNEITFLNNGNYYWTMSPNAFNGNYAYERSVSSNGRANVSIVNGTYGARPVLNLSSEILLQGTGTASDPYHLAS